MKNLYYLLLQLSEQSKNEEAAPALVCLDKDFNFCGLKLNFKDLRNLCDNLFQELDSKFKLLVSALHDVSASGSCELSENKSHLWAIVQELSLVLRCCLVSLTLIDSDQQFLLEKCRYFICMLKILLSFDVKEASKGDCESFKKFVAHKCTYADNGCTATVVEEFVACISFLEPSDPCRPFLCAVLEVFADELLLHRSLREYLMLVDSASSTVSDELAFDKFIKGLIWQLGKDCKVPELGLTSSVSLLLQPIMLSAPKMFQAHMISVVSEAIGVGLSSENLTSDPRLMDCYLIAFERSVNFYKSHMSSLQLGGYYIGSKVVDDSSLPGRSQPSFESYFRKDTVDKLNYLLSTSDKSWDSYIGKLFFKTKTDLLAESVIYMKESQHVFTDSCTDIIVSVLNCIIHRSFCDDVSGNVLYGKGDTSPQDIYLLVSILKLMSTSLMQAVCCLRNSNSSCLKTLENASSCKEYDFMISIIAGFQQFNICLPIQNFLSDVMKSHQTRHKESKWMLLHFSGLLHLSFISGLDFLVKACISVLTALLCLFIYEEGDLVALGSLAGSVCSSEASCDKVGEGTKFKKSSQKVASKFHKIRELHSSMGCVSRFHRGTEEVAETSENVSILNSMDDSIDSIEEKTEEICNGEIFLNCILKGSEKSSDYDDIIDFIDCKRGKDYSSWLKDRQKYRKWRYQKMAVLRWKKKKKAWRLLNGSET
ncbi:2-isopropylmalate synthase [Quillaja saponaria]|uniref:2-isopropylmalate synthase n=1 Tax=Quillaja saponaria TaxID=32244 RepID=A0AAD7PBQ0_QUISA|nr:2-isopropylmalate synthase [Quillaja saponaria]